MDEEREPRVGALLREWRRRRKLSQLELSLLAETSARHLSCVETGKSRPSRAMVLRLAVALDVPLRERNALLLAADYAPAYRESRLDDREMVRIRAALDQMLTAHEPYPAVVLDRYWNVVAGNGAMAVLTAGLPPHLLEPAPNVFRMALHPEGLAARLANLRQVRELFLEHLRRQVDGTGDPRLRALHEEVSRYPLPAGHRESESPKPPAGPVQVPLRLRSPGGELSLFGTMATFGAPADVTLSELAIELFYPLDDFTAGALREFAAGR
ncbi:helix-turn-helix domain-containing protein [Streptomyces profundus]|uniref:helix-turn-helix domain-containing protein n=1 Tax=Streptomyces profundus TaxID=2867410 RepID=UPI001D163583|nr:helix-turn-helix transcriptional regulator [Streptomyces sp. MA3_2.13]UED83369.1 helix-turn-helix transcriptional regulator [Streptomyces sp. MA3_2.13]